MIRRLRYNEIDFNKYNACLRNSVEQNYYAQRSTLDFLSPGWELLVMDDYQFVMPVPVRKKYGIRFALMPLFCQQLGVSGPVSDPKIHQQFLHFLQQNYRIVYYAFHHSNQFSETLAFKSNYVIQPISYETQRRSFSKGRKSVVKNIENLNLTQPSMQDAAAFLAKHMKGLSKESDKKKFFDYLIYLKSTDSLIFYGAERETKLISLAVFIATPERLGLLALATDEQYRSHNGASFIIDQILRKYSMRTLDFMGSSIRGIEIFFKSFGSDLQSYAIIRNNTKDLLKSLFRLW